MNAKYVPPTHEDLLKCNVSYRTIASVHKLESFMLQQSLELSLRKTGEQVWCDKSSWEGDMIHQCFHICLQSSKDHQKSIINSGILNFRSTHAQ